MVIVILGTAHCVVYADRVSDRRIPFQIIKDLTYRRRLARTRRLLYAPNGSDTSEPSGSMAKTRDARKPRTLWGAGLGGAVGYAVALTLDTL